MNQIITDVLAERADSAPDPQLDPGAVIRRARRRRRTTRGFGAVVAVGIAATAVMVVPALWSDSATDTAPAGPGAPLDMDPWGPWIDGTTLHLGATDVEVTDARMLVAVPGGAVYSTGAGSVVWARADGTTETIGTDKQEHARVASDPRTGLVAWVEGGNTESPEIVVYDTAAGEEVARRPIASDGDRRSYLSEVGGYPIAIEGGTVWLRTYAGDYAWNLGTTPTQILPDGPGTADHYLVALTQGVEAVQLGDEQFGTRIGPVVVDGSISLLSPGGRYAAGEPAMQDRFAVWDTTEGVEVDTLLPGRFPANVIFTAPTEITYAVAGVGGRPDEFLTCDLPTQECSSVPTEFAGRPILANGLDLS